MTGQSTSKLNQLQRDLPNGLLAPAHWLVEHGYYRQLLDHYVASRWLESPARGVYRRPGSTLKWQHLVASLQTLVDSPREPLLHLGGRTALVQQGLAHYLRLGEPEEIQLFGPTQLPAWTRKLPLTERFVVRTDAMFHTIRVWRSASGHLEDFEGRALSESALGERGLVELDWGLQEFRLIHSAPERAILELLNDVPTKESVYEADVLMEGLVNLRPARLSLLLRTCESVKVKRLFLALADRHQHAWLGSLDLTGVDLGSGKRMLVSGGKLHPKYLITLPPDLDDHNR